MMRVCSIILILAVSAFAQKKTQVYLPTTTSLSGTVYSADGKMLARRDQKSREPIMVVDTVKLVSGSATLSLQSHFGAGQHSVVPTSTDRLSVQLSPNIGSSSGAVGAYGWFLSADRKTLTIKSSSVADTNKVCVTMIVR